LKSQNIKKALGSLFIGLCKALNFKDATLMITINFTKPPQKSISWFSQKETSPKGSQKLAVHKQSFAEANGHKTKPKAKLRRSKKSISEQSKRS